MNEETQSYPATLEITPLSHPPVATVHVPGSKSITNRALPLAALFGHRDGCELRGALRCEDTEVMIDALKALGFHVEADWAKSSVQVFRRAKTAVIPATEANLFVGNSGTTMRFLTALVCLGHGRYRLDGVPRMRERPIEGLLACLRQLGVRVHSEQDNGCPPVIVEANGISGGQVSLQGDVSSQFLSGLMMAAPLAGDTVTINVEGPLVSTPYVLMTMEMMNRHGLKVDAEVGMDFFYPRKKDGTNPRFIIPGKQKAAISAFAIEPDASAASYFLAAAAIMGGELTVSGLGLRNSIQGDVAFANVLVQMGCTLVRENELTIRGRPLHGIDVDMNEISDTVMTLAAVACFANRPTTIRNVGHIRHKESDRLHALAVELRRIGAQVDEFADGLTITPRPLHGAVIETYDDHRMAMSMALIGLKVPGIVIKDPGCVAKTYPEFFQDLERLRK